MAQTRETQMEERDGKKDTSWGQEEREMEQEQLTLAVRCILAGLHSVLFVFALFLLYSSTLVTGEWLLHMWVSFHLTEII